ncbi:hypothetical protein CGCSCA1_v009322 [Colletotrichum siamense]|nr:hypothetical protein CGCSCA1_v009322 [Colletotrichum siamense]
MLRTFPSIRFGLMVGIGGGVPRKGSDVRLGDVVVSSPTGQFGGVVQWDMGKTKDGGKFERTGFLNSPPASLLSALSRIETQHDMNEPRIQEFLDEMTTKWPKLAATYGKSENLVDILFKSSCHHEDKPDNVGSDSDDDYEDNDDECRFCDKSKTKSRKPASRGL